MLDPQISSMVTKQNNIMKPGETQKDAIELGHSANKHKERLWRVHPID